MISIPEDLQASIDHHGVDSYPYEGCGLLLGRVEDGVNVVVEIRPIPNTWPNEEEKRVRFRIDEQEWLSAEFDAMTRDLDIVGIFHSHPDHPAIASPRDLAWASWPGYSYLITEIRNGKVVGSRSWQLNDDRTNFYEEPVSVLTTTN